MTVTRVHTQPRAHQTFGRAKISRPVLVLLAVLRVYAIVAVTIAVVSFFRAIW